MSSAFQPLPTLDAFWDNEERKASVSIAQLTEFETRYGYPVPPPFKALYSISDGGWTDYTSLLVNDKLICPFFSNRLPEFSDWEMFGDYARSFDLDDEATLAFTKQQNAHIIFRHGFEYFVIFWPVEAGYCYGILDFAVPFDTPVKLTMLPIDDDPTRSFVKPLNT